MRRPRKSINQINVVPYIDVMLVLLVIFMVTAPLVNPGEIELPSVGSKLTVPAAPLEVTLRPDRTLWLRDQQAQIRNVTIILIGTIALLSKSWFRDSISDLAYTYLGNLAASFAVYFVVAIATPPGLHHIWTAVVAQLLQRCSS